MRVNHQESSEFSFREVSETTCLIPQGEITDCLGRFESRIETKVLITNVNSPLVTVPLNASHQPTSFCPLTIVAILTLSGFTKIDPSIVTFILVDMVNLLLRPLTCHVKPGQPSSIVVFIVDAYLAATTIHDPTSYVAWIHFTMRLMHEPRPYSSLWIV